MESLTEELFNISKNELHKLPIFLKKYGNYEMLKDIIKNAEVLLNKEEKNNKKSFLKNFMLGNLGYEYYKQSAFYELPTNELIFTILSILYLFDITHCYELYAGTGLITKMLKIHHQTFGYKNIKWECSDDCSWIETVNNNIFNNEVEKKCFLSYITKKQVPESDCYIFCWPDSSIKNYISKFCKEKNPNIIILIDNINRCSFDNKTIIKNKYKKINLNIKQICYNDVIKYFDKYSVSSTTIYIKNELYDSMNLYGDAFNEFIINNAKNFIKYNFNSYNNIITNILLPSNYQLNIENIKLSLIDNYKVPEEFINLPNDYFENAIKLYDNSIDKINIPIFLKTVDDIICWMKLYKIDNCPENISSYDKFIEFMKLYKRTYDDLEGLKRDGVIPLWVSDRGMARKCISLDYSLNDKKWKKSEYQFKKYIS
jgi:hypothetical protein